MTFAPAIFFQRFSHYFLCVDAENVAGDFKHRPRDKSLSDVE